MSKGLETTTCRVLPNVAQSAKKTGILSPFGPMDGWLSNNLRAYLLLRAVLYVENVSYGGKIEAVEEAAAFLGVKRRTVYDWRERFREHGLAGLMRQHRSDRGRPRSLSPEVLDAIRQRQMMRGRGNVSSVWKALGKPATYQTFRKAVRAVEDRRVVGLHVA